MKKLLSLAISSALLLTLLAGCSSGEPKPEDNGDVSEDAPKVALILGGPISDMSFNAAAYNGLLKIEEQGAEIFYQENVTVSALPDSIATYASEGCDLIYLSTSYFTETGIETAAEYPDTQFVLVSGDQNSENVSTVQIADEHQGFLMGAAAALLSETKSVGFIGGLEITPIIAGSKGFEQGVEYIDNGTEAKVIMTGSFEDVNKAKETAKAMLDSGVDVICPLADQAGLGIMEAVEESGKMAISSGAGLDEKAPTTTVLSIGKDTSTIYEATYKQYLEGTLSDDIQRLGAESNVVYIDKTFEHSALTEEILAELKEIEALLVSGEIVVNLD